MNIIEAMAQAGGSEWVRKVSGSASEKVLASSKTRSADSVSISSDARKLSSGSASAVRARVEALPASREDLVQDVRAKVESGYYDTSKFHDALAEKLVPSLYGS